MTRHDEQEMVLDSVRSAHRELHFVDSCRDQDGPGYCYTPSSEPSLYATCYAAMLKWYIGCERPLDGETEDFILGWQDPSSGFFVGPELRAWTPPAGSKHDREHLSLHATCTVLPVLQEHGIEPRFSLHSAHDFCDQEYLAEWLDRRDMTDAWLEGNNLLFVGQLLVYLRDVEMCVQAQSALDLYFEWLDTHVDPATGLWGTDGYCSPFVAMCGGYHQLLVYYYENHPVLYRENLVDTVLALQHRDGGFSPAGGGGACEDADAVDILVNMYKQVDYRQAEVRHALRRCARHLRRLQNPDGGFPYGKNAPFSHMGVPATGSSRGASNLFATWFRVHTLALIAEVLPEEVGAKGGAFRFNSALSMGWHREWDASQHRSSPGLSLAEVATGYRSRLGVEMRYVRQVMSGVCAKLRTSWR